MRQTLFAAALATSTALVAPVSAEPVEYALDPSHSQILFSYNHLGYSTTWGMFSGFEGQIMFDQENPENSSVAVSMPVTDMFTGWEQRTEHFMSGEFFDASAGSDDDLVTFTSTSITVTGENTAEIIGDLTLNGITQEVVLDATLNQAGPHPMENKPWAGFDATTTLTRSDFGLGMFAPFVSDEVQVMISIEAQQADSES